jgi:hypothetical protein
MVPASIELDWVRGRSGEWLSLDSLDLTHPHFVKLIGVYVIWAPTGLPAAVRVGQGAIAKRLCAHRENPEIRHHDVLDGPLLATWAWVPGGALDGVERYLGLMLRPRVGSLFPCAALVFVNLPWSTSYSSPAQ